MKTVSLCFDETRSIPGDHQQGQQDQRLAEMIASGEVRFPMDRPPQELGVLVEQVRCLRRRRLLEFLAEQIAAEIHNGRDLTHKE